MYMKVRKHSGNRIVAACEKGLIGKVLEEGSAVLDLDAYASFYVGEPATTEELKKELRGCSSANLVGKKAVKVAVESGFARETDVKYIKNVPHLQIYRI